MVSIEARGSFRCQKYIVCFVAILFLLDLTGTAWAQSSRDSKQRSRDQKPINGASAGQLKAKGAGSSSSSPKSDGGGGELTLSKPVAPEKYVLGPGDQLAINLWGEYDSFEQYTVSAEGKVSIPTIGQLKFKGLTLAEADALLRNEVVKYYRNVKSGISLTSLRSFVVPVLGAVKQPGNYKATLDKQVSDLIETAGGVQPGGSQRHIQILQDGKVRTTSDLTAFLRRGQMEANPYLRDGDVIYVPPVRGDFITVFDDGAGLGDENAVALPIMYELVEGQRFSSVVSDLGGVNPAWDKENAYIIRQVTGSGDSQRIPVDLSQSVIRPDDSKDIVMQGGDELFFAVDLRRPYLNGLGEVISAKKDKRRAQR